MVCGLGDDGESHSCVVVVDVVVDADVVSYAPLINACEQCRLPELAPRRIGATLSGC